MVKIYDEDSKGILMKVEEQAPGFPFGSGLPLSSVVMELSKTEFQ
ncbi:hypothetical protein [Peribacillus simplex]